MLELKKQLVGQDFECTAAALERSLLPKAMWELLASLNSGRVLPCDESRTYEFVKQAAAMPFTDAFPVFAYVVENAVGKYQERHEASRVLRQMFNAVLTAADLFEGLAERTSAIFPNAIVPGVDVVETGITLLPGNGDEVVGYYGSWLSEKAREELWINDPFVTPEELAAILRVVLAKRPDLQIYAVTCRTTLEQEKVKTPYSESFRSAWTQASLHTAPTTRVIIASLEPSGRAPVHDRWWLSKEGGLDFGTSATGFGGARISRVDPMSQAQFNAAVEQLRPIVQMKKRGQGVIRISYESFEL